MKIGMLIAAFMVVVMSSCRSSDLFKGEPSFSKREAEMSLTLKKSRMLLMEYLAERGRVSVAHPEEVVMVHKGGYLFIQGDFKFTIPLKGYFVDKNGNVSYVDLKRSISVKSYMRKLGRKGWKNSLKEK